MNNESPMMVTADCARANNGHSRSAILSQLGRFAPLAITALLTWFAMQILIDAEYIGQNFSLRGLKVFRQFALPGQMAMVDPLAVMESAFPEGASSVDPFAIRQGGVYDCKFLASLISFAHTRSGKNAVLSMVNAGRDANHVVTFPGQPQEHVTVPPLTQRESIVYAKALDADDQPHGSWVPLIEKAYGIYRNEHQSWWHKALRTVKHGMFDGRWTHESELAGFGAAYGAADEEAIKLLTGSNTKVMQTATMEIGEFGLGKSYATFRQLRSWMNRDAVLQEFYNEQHLQFIDMCANNKVAIATTELCGIDKVYGLSSGHAYAVIGYDPVNRLVLLQDPQGPGGDVTERWTGEARDGVNDGVFEVTLPEFNRFFSHLRMAE